MKNLYTLLSFLLFTTAFAAPGAYRLQRQTASGAWVNDTVQPAPNTILVFDSAGKAVAQAGLASLQVGTLNLVDPIPASKIDPAIARSSDLTELAIALGTTFNSGLISAMTQEVNDRNAAIAAAIAGVSAGSKSPGEIFLWSTADIDNRPAGTLLCNGTLGTLDLTSAAPAGTSYIVMGPLSTGGGYAYTVDPATATTAQNGGTTLRWDTITLASGNVTKMGVQIAAAYGGTETVWIELYSGTTLVASAQVPASATGWVEASITPVAVSAGSYNVAVTFNGTSVEIARTTTGTHSYDGSGTYSTATAPHATLPTASGTNPGRLALGVFVE